MDKDAQERITRFMNDRSMSRAVKNVLVDSFMRKSINQDVQHLAAQRVAIDLLFDGWKELERYANTEEKEPRHTRQVGM